MLTEYHYKKIMEIIISIMLTELLYLTLMELHCINFYICIKKFYSRNIEFLNSNIILQEK